MTQTKSQRLKNCPKCKGQGYLQTTRITYTGEDLGTGKRSVANDGEDFFRVFMQTEYLQGNEAIRAYLKENPNETLYSDSQRKITKEYKLCDGCKGERKRNDIKENNQKVI